ncbi:hypothetical protein [Nocardia fluminea]
MGVRRGSGLMTGAVSLSPATEHRLPWQSSILTGVALALVA